MTIQKYHIYPTQKKTDGAPQADVCWGYGAPSRYNCLRIIHYCYNIVIKQLSEQTGAPSYRSCKISFH